MWSKRLAEEGAEMIRVRLTFKTEVSVVDQRKTVNTEGQKQLTEITQVPINREDEQLLRKSLWAPKAPQTRLYGAVENDTRVSEVSLNLTSPDLEELQK